MLTLQHTMSRSHPPNFSRTHYAARYSIAALAWICNTSLIVFLLTSVTPSENLLWLPLLTQALCSICYIANPEVRLHKQLRCLGAFHFVYQGFFLMRPLYIVLESEHKKVGSITGGGYMSDEILFYSVLYSSLGLTFFHLGTLIYGLFIQGNGIKGIKEVTLIRYQSYRVYKKGMVFLLVSELILLVVVIYVDHLVGDRSLTSFLTFSSAYVYMLPVVGSGISTSITVLVSCAKNTSMGVKFLFFAFHILYQLVIQDFSQFRINYMSGVIIAGLSTFYAFKRRQVSGVLLFSTVILLLPIVRFMGSATVDSISFRSGEFLSAASELLNTVSLKDYWNFFDIRGDLNIFDMFASGIQSVEVFHPDKSYVMPWLYVLVHWVPRQIWPEKPSQGIFFNQDFMNGLPFSPGIVGAFFLEGGFLWMLLCMFSLGLIISHIDSYILKIRGLEKKAYFYAVAIVMTSFLVRSVLYPPVYYALYFLVARQVVNIFDMRLKITSRY